MITIHYYVRISEAQWNIEPVSGRFFFFKIYSNVFPILRYSFTWNFLNIDRVHNRLRTDTLTSSPTLFPREIERVAHLFRARSAIRYFGLRKLPAVRRRAIFTYCRVGKLSPAVSACAVYVVRTGDSCGLVAGARTGSASRTLRTSPRYNLGQQPRTLPSTPNRG